MSEWKEVFVADLGRVITGNTPPRKHPELYGNHTIFIKPTDISEEQKYTYNPEECYSELGFKKYKNSLIPKGATCVVTIGSIGKKMTKAHSDCFVNQAVNAVVPNEFYDEEFVYYVLKYNLEQLKSLDSGTASGRENVSKSSFSSIKLKVPVNKSIQVKIGQILSAYDDLIENNQKRIKLYCEIAKILFNRINHEGDDLIEYEMKDIASYLGRGVTPIYEEGSGIWAINQKANKGVFLEEQHFKEYKGGNWIPEEKWAKDGDLLINSLGEGTIGRCHFYKGQDDIHPIDQHISIFRGQSKEIGLYVFQFLDSDEGQALLYSLKKGGTNMTMLNIKDLRNLKVYLPNKNILNNHFNSVEPLFAQKAKLESQNRRLKEARDILLPLLMNGTINVTVAETKPAAKIIQLDTATQKQAAPQFKEAILISMLTDRFGNEKYPLGRMRYTKLSYLFHRHADDQIKDYLRKAAGPYNPKTKYGGSEKIAHDNGYVIDKKNGQLTGFVAGPNIKGAKPYFEKYWNIEYLTWLEEQFKYKSNDDLELFATVDNSLLELNEKNEPFTVEAVKNVLKKEPEWNAKLEREIFNDANIQRAITYLPTIFQY
ncbi:restriction endonuclease subunit S [Mucilaginibacter auburnensis]|uniref:Restriction endonuclease S subunit n=1 Tax=Mucilaginibacter auburnensis TaxID=1457233 RepID=A0A2H9VV24_9SPHI|nr:restriction endonuclease subunit S [Mucilaginibacter auburnensis]PJJ84649.1 restriction endonuclease S subunit [Mucilaginibacter auburnensis]